MSWGLNAILAQPTMRCAKRLHGLHASPQQPHLPLQPGLRSRYNHLSKWRRSTMKQKVLGFLVHCLQAQVAREEICSARLSIIIISIDILTKHMQPAASTRDDCSTKRHEWISHDSRKHSDTLVCKRLPENDDCSYLQSSYTSCTNPCHDVMDILHNTLFAKTVLAPWHISHSKGGLNSTPYS